MPLAVCSYLSKKINRIILEWPLKTSSLNYLERVCFVWKSFAPSVNVINVPLQFLCFIVFLSVIFSQYPGLSFLAFMGKFIKGVFLYFSIIEAFSDKKSVGIFLYSLMASAFLTSLSGAVQHYTGRDFIKGHLIGTENLISSGRINSTFFGANGFGACLIAIIGLMAHMLFSSISQQKAYSKERGSGFWLGHWLFYWAVSYLSMLDIFQEFLGWLFDHIVCHVILDSR